LFLTLPFSAFCARWAITWAAKAPVIPYHEALRTSVWVAIAFELSQQIIFKVHRATGRKWVLATCILPEELETLRSQVEQSEAAWWIQIKPVNLSPTDTELKGAETLVISRGAVQDLRKHPEFLMAHLRGQRIVDVGQLLKEFRGR